MATPTTPEERLYSVGYKKSSAWGTEVKVLVTDELKVLKDGDLATARKQDMLPLKESNNTFLQSVVAGAVTACDFTPELYARYEMGPLGTMLAQLFGAAAAPSDLTGAYSHPLLWAQSVAGLFGSYASEYPGKVFSVPSAKPYKIVLSLQDGILKASPTMRGNVVIDNSAVNTTTTMDDLLGAAQGALIKFAENNVCWLALASHADAMSANEAVPISGFEITYGRGLEASKVQNGAAYLAEPGEEEFPDIRVKLDFPKNDAGGTATDNTLFFDDFQDGTAWQLQMEFTGGIIGVTAHHYALKLFFPKLLVAAVPDTKKAGMVKTSVEFIAVASTAAVPVGMIDSLFPYITIINTRATSYLA